MRIILNCIYCQTKLLRPNQRICHGIECRRKYKAERNLRLYHVNRSEELKRAARLVEFESRWRIKAKQVLERISRKYA